MKKKNNIKKITDKAPMAIFGQDKHGHVVIYEDLEKYDCKEISENLEIALKVRKRMWSLQYNKNLQMCKESGHDYYKHVNVFNVKNIGISQVKTFKDFLKKMMNQEEHLLPETVHKMYLINTGMFFSMIWALVKLFIHPLTRKKINILGSEYYYLPELKKEIDANQIPKKFGGDNETEIKWGDMTLFGDQTELNPSIYQETLQQDWGSAAKVEAVVEKAETGDSLEKAQKTET